MLEAMLCFTRRGAWLGLACLLVLGHLAAEPENRIVLNLEPSAQNPRNSEGSFATLASGKILFCFGQFYGGGQDDSPARIGEMVSSDQGRTWSRPRVAFDNASNRNVMSVSLLRLAGGKLAIFYIVKKDRWLDGRPVMRVSADEGATWSEPRSIIAVPGYWELNNDRAVQLKSGRIILPLAYYRTRGLADNETSFDSHGLIFWYYSDDEGRSWKEAATWWGLPVADKGGMQEPGVVVRADGSLFSWARTGVGSQYVFESRDDGVNWSPPRPSALISPMSPASIKRLPGSDELLAIYNDHSGRFPYVLRRSPLVAAISTDGGRTWPRRKRVEDDPKGWYCYTAIHFVDDAVLLAYCAGDDQVGGLARLRIRRLARTWLP